MDDAPAAAGRPASSATDVPGSDAPIERRWSTIEAKLRAAEFWLQDQGGLVAKAVDGRRAWVVRVVVVDARKRKHRSIYIGGDGDAELLRRARALLAGFRAEGDALKALGRWASLAAMAAGDARRRRSPSLGRHRHAPRG